MLGEGLEAGCELLDERRWLDAVDEGEVGQLQKNVSWACEKRKRTHQANDSS